MRFCLFLSLAVIAATVYTQEPVLTTSLATLVQAERDFAKYSVDHGMRAAFLNFFADDGINFQPHPTKTREAFLKRSDPVTRNSVVLNWAPILAEVSQAGDLGYTTGPYILEDTRNQQHGLYSSVWKKQPDGSWKVVLDIGVQLPIAASALDAKLETPLEAAGKRAPQDVAAVLNELQKVEQDFVRLAASSGGKRAYSRYASERIRIHMQGAKPVVTKKEFHAWLIAQNRVLKLALIKTEVASSGDLGYSYGRFESKNETGSLEKGYFAHIWRRFSKIGWRLVFEVTNSLPVEKG